MRRLLEFLKEQEVEYYEEYSLKPRSSIGTGGKAKLALFPNDTKKLLSILSFINENGYKFRVLGNLTNTLISDNGYDGVALFTTKINRYYLAENEICLECGSNFSAVIKKISRLGYGGLSELYMIPGSTGGMVYSNAGAYGKCVSDSFISCEAYSHSDNKTVILTADELAFGYRDSMFKSRGLTLLSAKFKTERKPCYEIEAELSEIKNKRLTSQPREKSLGSIFKRSGDIPVSKIIDELGLKGVSVGGAEVSPKHAGFIINRKGATTQDILELIDLIRDKVFSFYGFSPSLEIELLE